MSNVRRSVGLLLLLVAFAFLQRTPVRAAADEEVPADGAGGAEAAPAEPNPLWRSIAEVRFDNVTLEQAIDRLRDLTHANIVVDWPALEGAGVPRDTVVRLHLWDVTLNTALRMILGGIDPTLEYDVEDNVVVVFVRGGWGALEVRVYDVRDLVESAVAYETRSKALIRRAVREAEGNPPAGAEAADPDAAAAANTSRRFTGGGLFENDSRGEDDAEVEAGQVLRAGEEGLVDAVMEGVGPDDWAGTGSGPGVKGRMNYWSGRLIVRHTAAGHRRVEALLKKLREAGGATQPVTGSRPVP